MLNRLFFPALALLAVAMVALAAVWPQGLGDRSPPPFGHTPVQQTPEMQAAMKREHEAAQKRLTQAREAVSDLQTQAIAPTK
jgi:hypothetical protein